MSMNILAAADFHEEDGLVDAVVDEANSGEYDLFLAPGDFVDADSYTDMMERVDIPRFACTGNWDFNFTPPENDEYDHLFNYMKVEHGDYRIAIIGSIFPDDFMDDIEEWVDGFDNRKFMVMSHYPPERLGDATVTGTRAGMPGFRKMIMKLKPAAWFCGHIHEAFGQYHLMRTEVFNCAVVESGKCFSVELDDGVESFEEVELL